MEATGRSEAAPTAFALPDCQWGPVIALENGGAWGVGLGVVLIFTQLAELAAGKQNKPRQSRKCGTKKSLREMEKKGAQRSALASAAETGQQ